MTFYTDDADKGNSPNTVLRRARLIRQMADAAGARLSTDLVEEVVCTRDHYRDDYAADGTWIGWTMTAVRPLGPGWIIKDASSDKKTWWVRFIVAAPSISTTNN